MKRRNFIWYFLLFIVGCRGKVNNTNAPGKKLPEKLRLAVTDVKGLEGLERDYEQFRQALEEVLATPIEFFPVEEPFQAIAALKSAEVDLLWAGPSEYVVARARTNAVPLVTIVRPDYYAVIAVRGDSGIRSVADLKGKSIDMLRVGSNVSHIGSVKLLINAGLDPKSDVTIVMSGVNSLEGLKNGEVDAWARAPHQYRAALEQEGASESKYPLIAKGSQFPGDVLVAGSHLEPEGIGQIRDRILQREDKLIQSIVSVAALAKFKNVNLTAANDSDYEMIREAYKAMGQGDFLR
jgi:phosphonate transport system substrate-binding protein